MINIHIYIYIYNYIYIYTISHSCSKLPRDQIWDLPVYFIVHGREGTLSMDFGGNQESKMNSAISMRRRKGNIPSAGVKVNRLDHK